MMTNKGRITRLSRCPRIGTKSGMRSIGDKAYARAITSSHLASLGGTIILKYQSIDPEFFLEASQHSTLYIPVRFVLSGYFTCIITSHAFVVDPQRPVREVTA